MNVDYIEFPITHLCSLHCDRCSAYSNYVIPKTVPLDVAETWMRAWSERVSPVRFRILGGEPFLHPKLPEIMTLSRDIFKDAEIEVCTNGLNMGKHPGIEKTFKSLNIGISLSLHAESKEYNARVISTINLLSNWEIFLGIKNKLGNNVDNWNRFYQGIGENMTPFDDRNPRMSYRVCHSKHCVNLVDGRLWKCPQIGNLHLIAERFKLDKREDWKPYLAYTGIGLDCSDDELQEFFKKRAEPICGMCPTRVINYYKSLDNLDFTLKDLLVERPER